MLTRQLTIANHSYPRARMRSRGRVFGLSVNCSHPTGSVHAQERGTGRENGG